MDSGQMFQPNSIRSLLSKRTSSRASSAKMDPQQYDKSASKGIDNDYDSIIETKMIIQDIDNKVNNIRQWRNQQKQLTSQRLKHNAELAEEIKKERMLAMEREQQLEKEQLKRMLQKLALKAEIKINQNQEEYDSQKIFQVLSSTENMRKAFKNNSEYVTSDEHQSFLRSINGINEIFKKKEREEEQQGIQESTKQNAKEPNMELSVLLEKEKAKNGDEQKLNKEALQKELEEIDRELREIEELMGDE